MSISLSYMDDLSRVRIELSGLPDGTVLAERSLQQTLWDTVRGGRTLQVSSGSAQIDDYEFYADVTTHYRVSPVDPPAGLLLDGSSGDYASTPDASSLNITGDLDLRAEVSIDDWTPDTAHSLIGKWEQSSTDERQYMLRLETDGALRLFWSPDGAAQEDATSTATVTGEDLVTAGGDRLAVRATLDVDDGSGGHVVTFYSAPSLGGPWTQLGDAVVDSGGTTSVWGGPGAPLEVGARDGGDMDNVSGIVHAVEIRDGIGGTLATSPDFAAQPGGAASFDDDQGLTWTVQGDAEIVGTWSDSITASLNGEVWLKSIRYPMLNRIVRPLDRNDEIARSGRSSIHDVVGSPMPVTQHEYLSSEGFDLQLLSSASDYAALDLMAVVGGTLFVHVPDGSAVPSGYVTLTGLSRTRLHRGSSDADRVLVLSCRVERPPGPRVVGTTLTWATVRRLYGDSWAAVAAAHPDWASLLATVGSADDVVVI